MILPLQIKRFGSSFIIQDAAGLSLASVYFDKGNASERSIRKLMSEDEAEEMAKRIARFLTDETTKEPPPPEGSGG